jgi:hypothetical protein
MLWSCKIASYHFHWNDNLVKKNCEMSSCFIVVFILLSEVTTPKVPYSRELDPYLMMYILQRDYFCEFCAPL